MIRTTLNDVLELRGIKKKWLAEQTRITPTTLSFLVSGKRIPTMDVAFRIARVLDLRIDELWQYEED